jgi:hypothetical protein
MSKTENMQEVTTRNLRKKQIFIRTTIAGTVLGAAGARVINMGSDNTEDQLSLPNRWTFLRKFTVVGAAAGVAVAAASVMNKAPSSDQSGYIKEDRLLKGNRRWK